MSDNTNTWFSDSAPEFLKELVGDALETTNATSAEDMREDLRRAINRPKRWELSEQESKKIKGECLAHLFDAEPMPFIEIHGFADMASDYLIRPDEDGDWISMGSTHELRHLSDIAVRVLIHADTDKKTAVRLLKKNMKCIKRMTYKEFDERKPSEPSAPSAPIDDLEIPF